MTLKVLYQLFANHPEGAWIMRPDNAQKLYEFIKESKIEKVLSLGTGIGLSDAVISLAWKDKGVKGHIDSIEQYDKCIKIAQELIPAELKDCIQIHKSEPEVWSTPEMPYQFFSVYKTLPEPPEGGWELIVNDGPSPFLINNEDIISH